VSSLVPFLTKLKESGAEKLLFSPGELTYAVEGDKRRPVAGGPVSASTILQAVSELLSHDDIQGLPSNRPRIVRHEHDGEDYVLEVIRQSSGIALAIRLSPRAPVKLRDSFRDPAQSPPAREAKEAKRAEPQKTKSRRFRPSQVPAAAGPVISNKRTVRAMLDDDGNPMDDEGRPLGAAMRPSKGALTAPKIELAIERGDLPPARAAKPFEEAATIQLINEPPASEPVRVRSGPARIDTLLREMIERKASDLHLSAGNAPVMRVHGEIHFLKDRAQLSSADVLSMMREIMTDKARADFDALNDADFAHEIPGLARFRVNVFQDRKGTGCVLRQIPIEIIPAEKLGIPPACLDLCWLSKGLVVVTGPTGSGKSTTLASMIDFINKNRSDHIITIEDPVEFVHGNIKCLVNQREVGQHTKSFKNALRAALREDPDIVLVGEMRDLETIAIAIETAETGHLVFGTLHTTTATSTVDRIIDQFPADRQAQIRVMLSESLKGVIAQILLPKIGGGRVAAHEVLLGTTAVSAIIRDGKTFQLPSIMQTSKGQGMITMNDSLMQLVQRRLVEPKAAYVKAVDKAGLLAMFKAANIPTDFK
jgi:twitching motility protein PilT